MTYSDANSPLHRMFAGLTEQTFFSQLGVADTVLVDYLADLLERFIRSDAVFGLRNTRGERLLRIGEMLSEADQRLGEARRSVHRHIGDFALFWTGVYPEALRRSHGGDVEDQYRDYCLHGKRAYYLASTMRTSEEDRQSELFERLSQEFEMCAYGLHEVRREWERRDGEFGVPIIVN